MDESVVGLLEEDLEQAEEELGNIEEFSLTPQQDGFIFSPAKFGGFGGGMGNGKSFAGCIKAHNHCIDQPGAFFLIGRRNAIDLRDSTLKDFLALFSDEGTWSEKTMTFSYPNGSQIIFRHLDDLRKLTNMNLSGAWIDQAEEVDEQAFIFLNGRIRRRRGTNKFEITRREIFITFNMNGHDWIWRRFLQRKDVDGSPLKNADSYFLVVATSMDNPHLTEDYIETLLAMPDDWVKRYVHGSWDVFAGQIFSEWNQAIHVIPGFAIPNHWPRYRAIDHGQLHPTVCLWGAVDYEGNVYIYQEYWQEDTPVSQHVLAIKQMSLIKTTAGAWIMDDYDGTYIDPSTHAKTREKDGMKFSVADEYYDAGIMTMPAQNDVLAGINRVKEYLRINAKRWHPTKLDDTGQPIQGAPKLYVFERCLHLREEMGDYKWKPPRFGNEEDMQVEKPVKRKDDAVDTLRYLLASRPAEPDSIQNIDPRVLKSPIELARYCADLGMSVEDFMITRYGRPGNRDEIRHSDSGIRHSDSDIQHSGSFN